MKQQFKEKETRKLYEIPRNSPLKVMLNDGTIDNAEFGHIDGMYSFCTTSKGGIFHLDCTTPMIFINGRWQINLAHKYE